MKVHWIKKLIAAALAGVMAAGLAASGAPARVHAEENTGKYVSDVFIAYGKTEKDAQKWLTDNGWEPVKGDFNAGKASFFDNNKVKDQNVAAVMGIKRTDKADDAITDMAVMNMTGGYSFADYEDALKQKKAEINEFINNFMVVIDEYRANYNGEGSDFGKERAALACDVLNKFSDGGESEEYPLNDTGMQLGDLFLQTTVQEGDENGGDLQQLMLETSGPALLIMETYLALGADAGQETWLERASALAGEDMTENLHVYVPEAADQDISDSVALQLLSQYYGDTAALLSEQWAEINEAMVWYEQYSDANSLWPDDGESEEDYNARVEAHFDKRIKADEAEGEYEKTRYFDDRILYANLYEAAYAGDWGETMGDFFNPADGADYSDEEYFLPMAAALSDGQRAAMDFLSLHTLLLLGSGDTEAFKITMPDIKELLGEMESVSIYTGVNRAAFRGGVAMTDEALMEQNAGNGNAYDKIWDNEGIAAMTSYAAAIASVPMIIGGGVMAAKGIKYVGMTPQQVAATKENIELCKANFKALMKRGNKVAAEEVGAEIHNAEKGLNDARTVTKMGAAGRWILGIGGVLLIGAAIVKGVQLWKYYDRDMKPIPRMIAEKADVITYTEGKDGSTKKNIDFKTYEFYSAVHCNRPEVGEIGDWQDGVEEYKEHNCYDVADLNADMGQEWVALYTVKSLNKGCPILADSLTMQYGSSKTPEGCTKAMHLFTYTNAVDLGDTAWAFNNDKKGVYFFWDEDTAVTSAVETASAFSGGSLALAGIAGLVLGIIGSSLFWVPKRRKEEEQEAV